MNFPHFIFGIRLFMTGSAIFKLKFERVEGTSMVFNGIVSVEVITKSQFFSKTFWGVCAMCMH